MKTTKITGEVHSPVKKKRGMYISSKNEGEPAAFLESSFQTKGYAPAILVQLQ